MSADCPWRVGIGYDVHRLEAGRQLRLGGVAIDYPRGLVGHSDGDAVLHAVTDALLGAAGFPDIGILFPDTEPGFEGADSRELLADAVRRVREAGLSPVNVDCVIHAEAPKLGPYKARMAEAIGGAMGVAPEAVSVKATTHEGLGPIGGGEAIACTAVVLVARVESGAVNAADVR